MTERRRGALAQQSDGIAIGPSSLRWDGGALVVDIDEVSAPLPTRIRGQVRVTPKAVTDTPMDLDPEAAHRWWPLAPWSQVEVTLARPELRWSGRGYFDMNWGGGPLERTFAEWDWSRAALEDGTAILYDMKMAEGGQKTLALRIDGKGTLDTEALPDPVTLPRTPIWRVPRRTHAEAGGACVAKTLEDTPFYARSVLESHLFGERALAVHESLSLKRFDSLWVQMLLPFRMPRTLR